VLANGSLSSKTSGEGAIRRALVEGELVDCIVALPEKLFLNTGIPVCLWFLAKNRANGKFRDRRGEVLLSTLDASVEWTHAPCACSMTRHRARHRHLPLVAESKPETPYADVAGFCKSGTHEEIATHDSCSPLVAMSALKKQRSTLNLSTRKLRTPPKAALRGVR